MSRKIVVAHGKVNRRLAKKQARNSFDQSMNSMFSGTAVLIQEAVIQSMKFSGFNVRRFAYWVKMSRKKISRDCVSILNAQFGTLGGLHMREHIAH